MDVRYQKYETALKGAPTLGEAFRVVAAYLSGLRDSHTFFVPPSLTYRFDYGFRMQMIGDRCLLPRCVRTLMPQRRFILATKY